MKKVLIVEDDADTIEIVETILNGAGYAVIKISREITIKDNPKTVRIRVILYSASILAEGLARKCKADGFLSKPFDLDQSSP